MHKVLVNGLDLSLPRESVVRLTDSLDITIVVDWDVKPQINQLITFCPNEKDNPSFKTFRLLTFGPAHEIMALIT